jgi:hypothetical protein
MLQELPPALSCLEGEDNLPGCLLRFPLRLPRLLRFLQLHLRTHQLLITRINCFHPLPADEHATATDLHLHPHLRLGKVVRVNDAKVNGGHPEYLDYHLHPVGFVGALRHDLHRAPLVRLVTHDRPGYRPGCRDGGLGDGTKHGTSQKSTVRVFFFVVI